MKRLKYLMVVCGAIALLSGCRSSRQTEADRAPELSPFYPIEQGGFSTSTDKTPETHKHKKSNKKEKEEQQATRSFSGVNTMTAKLNLMLESGQKRVNVGGTYRLKRNDVIQINLTYTMFFTINVGTLELTRDYILLLDRMNKRYCKVTYSDVPAMAQAGVDFNYLQRIFWGEAEQSPTRVLEWVYSNWTDFGQGQFPGELRFILNPNGSTTYRASFILSNLRESDDWETRTAVSSKYTEVSLETVMKALMNMTM